MFISIYIYIYIYACLYIFWISIFVAVDDLCRRSAVPISFGWRIWICLFNLLSVFLSLFLSFVPFSICLPSSLSLFLPPTSLPPHSHLTPTSLIFSPLRPKPEAEKELIVPEIGVKSFPTVFFVSFSAKLVRKLAQVPGAVMQFRPGM